MSGDACGPNQRVARRAGHVYVESLAVRERRRDGGLESGVILDVENSRHASIMGTRQASCHFMLRAS
jgi:hypothetical protein